MNYELSVACRECLCGYCILVFVLFCALEDLGDVGLLHLAIIIVKEYLIAYIVGRNMYFPAEGNMK